MPNDDHTLEAALSLVAGGAVGYATGRWIIDPWLASRDDTTATAGSLATPRPRALASGPVAPAVDFIIGPSGAMQPSDPYADVPSVAAPSSIPAPTVVTPTAPTSMPSMIVDGPITSPSQVDSSIAAPVRPGPITSPTQVVPSPPPVATSNRKHATSPGVRRFDPVFERYRGGLPIEYLRALVERESDGRPAARTGSAVGLMQIVPVVLGDYNKRHGTAYQTEQLADPATNVAMGCELLGRIVSSYRKNHPRIPNFQTDWSNPRFVELLTFGWNAGYSEAGGVGHVARYLEGLGAIDITLDQVNAHARLAGASKHLSNSAKVAWCKSVVALYQRERTLVATTRPFATS